jgi:hypothetical protein
VVQERPTLVCIQETKLSNICKALANEILGIAFAYDFLRAINVSGGILLGWNTDSWSVTNVTKGRFSILAVLTACSSPHDSWWITVVYGPRLIMTRSNSLMNSFHFGSLARGLGSCVATSI